MHREPKAGSLIAVHICSVPEDLFLFRAMDSTIGPHPLLAGRSARECLFLQSNLIWA